MRAKTRYRLADSTVVEPLVNCWSAWAHVISPATASLHLLNYQLEAMRSYLKDPVFHVRASRDPELVGGPFVDITVDRACEVKALMEATQEGQREQIEFARSLMRFQNWLVEAATGESLEPFYQRIPEELRGYSELVYDYYNRPSLRLIENLLYESKYYDKSLQSLRIFELKKENERPFFMSTPRLASAEQMHWAIPYDDPRVDELFRLDVEPQTLDHIRELLGLDEASDNLLLRFLSDEPVDVPDVRGDRGVRIRYFGHACVLVEHHGLSILTDPFIGARPSEPGIDRLSYQDLPARIDYALITHNHQDHFALETLLRLRPRIGCLVVPKTYNLLHGDVSLKLMAQRLGFKQVVELDSLEKIEMPDGAITAIPFLGEHGDLAHGKAAYVVRAGSEQMLFGADSDCLDDRIYKHIRQSLGVINTAFLGMECVGAPLSWSCGPLFPRKPQRQHEQTRRYHGCDARAGLRLLETIGAERFYNYAMGMEPWIEHLLGLGLSPDSTQIKESDKLLRITRGRGFRASERLFGTRDFTLCDSTGSVETAEEHANYWMQQLADIPPPLQLAMNTQGPATTFAGRASKQISLPDDLRRSIFDLSEQQAASPFLVLLAAFEALLHWCTGQEDILIGTTVGSCRQNHADRANEGHASILVLRTDFSEAPCFATALSRVREVLSRAYEHRAVPFDLIAEKLAAQRLPPFQVLFDAHTASTSHAQADDTRPELILSMVEGGDQTAITLEYDTLLFPEDAITLLIERFKRLLTNVLTDPSLTIREMPLACDGSDCDTSADPECRNDADDRFTF